MFSIKTVIGFFFGLQKKKTIKENCSILRHPLTTQFHIFTVDVMCFRWSAKFPLRQFDIFKA